MEGSRERNEGGKRGGEGKGEREGKEEGKGRWEGGGGKGGYMYFMSLFFISLIHTWKLIYKILSIIITLKCVMLSSQDPRPIVCCGYYGK